MPAEDGDGAGFPAPGGAPPQNWGYVQQAERDAGATAADLKASGFQPGDSCNGQGGFLDTPPPDDPEPHPGGRTGGARLIRRRAPLTSISTM